MTDHQLQAGAQFRCHRHSKQFGYFFFRLRRQHQSAALLVQRWNTPPHLKTRWPTEGFSDAVVINEGSILHGLNHRDFGGN